jgi:hypothetical protein
MSANAYRQRVMTVITVVLMAVASVTATIGLAGPAQADDEIDFRSPSGDIVCTMGHDTKDPARYGNGVVACQVLNHTYPQPPLADCPVAGREYDLEQGTPPSLGCQGGLIVDPLPPKSDYGQSWSVGTITCDLAPPGVTCTDSSTGHFLRLSRDSYQMG